MDRITRTILALGGDIYGDSLFQELCGHDDSHKLINNKDPFVIQCRLEPTLIHTFVSIIRTVALPFNENTKVTLNHDNPNVAYVHITDSQQQYNSVIVEVTNIKRINWNQHSAFFDIHLLAMSSYSVYCRLDYSELEHMPCRISWLLKRLRDKKFCVLDNEITSAKKLATLMSKAVALVKLGWTMDDIIHHSNTWVVAYHKDITNVRCKMNQDLNLKNMCISQHECPICKEEFQSHDIVVNLRCNHTFHVRCKHGEGGVDAWLGLQEKNTCPMCRRHIIPIDQHKKT